MWRKGACKGLGEKCVMLCIGWLLQPPCCVPWMPYIHAQAPPTHVVAGCWVRPDRGQWQLLEFACTRAVGTLLQPPFENEPWAKPRFRRLPLVPLGVWSSQEGVPFPGGEGGTLSPPHATKKRLKSHKMCETQQPERWLPAPVCGEL